MKGHQNSLQDPCGIFDALVSSRLVPRLPETSTPKATPCPSPLRMTYSLSARLRANTTTVRPLISHPERRKRSRFRSRTFAGRGGAEQAKVRGGTPSRISLGRLMAFHRQSNIPMKGQQSSIRDPCGTHGALPPLARCSASRPASVRLRKPLRVFLRSG